jgi:hypothetical protein
LLRRAPLPGRAVAPSKGDHHDHDRAGVPRQRASMPVLGRVGERSGKQGRFLRPRRDLGRRCRSDRARRADREIERCAGRKPANLGPSGGSGLTVPDGSGGHPRQLGDVGGDPPRLVARVSFKLLRSPRSARRSPAFPAYRAARPVVRRQQHNPRPLAHPVFRFGRTYQALKRDALLLRQNYQSRFRDTAHASLNHDSHFRNSGH